MIEATPAGTVVRITVRPKARTARFHGEHAGRLKLSVQAAPDKGRANREVLKLLASALTVAASDLTILRGQTSRNKDVLIRGLEPAEAAARLARHVEE